MEGNTYKKDIINYYKKNVAKGYTPEALKWALIEQGYPRVIVENAFEQADKELAKKAPKLKERPKIKYEIIDEQDRPVEIKKPWWKRVFGL